MVKIEFINTGHCHAAGKIAVNTWGWKKRKFPSIVAIIKHPDFGIILFDTGYGVDFFSATQKFPYCFYRWATPISHDPQQAVKNQLLRRGISAEEVNYIFISHFHADHYCGLMDFSNAKYIYSSFAAEEINKLSGFAAVKKAFLPKLLPDNFSKNSILLDEMKANDRAIEKSPFTKGIDFFGDRTMIAISLPGHAAGHMGMLVNEKIFLIGDAAWSLEALKSKHLPHRLAHFIHHDKQQYIDTFFRLHQLLQSNSEIDILPSHCWSVLK